MTEPDVAITDWMLSAACLLFAGLTLRRPADAAGLRPWLALYFISVSVASLCGGLVHAFFLDPQSTGSAILWPLTLLATGLTALASWAIGARLLFSPRIARAVIAIAFIQWACFSAIVLWVTSEFWIAIADNVPALLFLMTAIVLAYRRDSRAAWLLAIAGLALRLVAAALQYARVGIHPSYLSHNALYHLLEALAMWLLYLGTARLSDDKQPLGGRRAVNV